MTHQVLSNCLRPILKAESQWRKRRFIYFTLFGGAIGMLILTVFAKFFEWWSTPLSLAIFLGSLGVLIVGRIRISKQAPDLKELARKVEVEHPDLNAVLLTAMDMEPGPSGRLGFLQSQVLGQVTEHAIRNRWVRQVSEKKLSHAGWLQFASIAVFVIASWFLMGQIPKATGGSDQLADNKIDPRPTLDQTIEISVKPGDVEVEKGSRVIIEATFEGRVPPGAMVVLSDPDDGSERGRIPMKAGIDDSVFSAVAAKVDSRTRYEIRFEESKSDAFTIDTYEHPKLEQADATITPPAYARKEQRTVEDTRKISLLEGSEVAWSIKVNKPVTFGELFGEDDSVVELKPDPNDPTVLMASHVPDETLKYRLHLIDDKERPNKRPPWFTVTVKKNLPPKLEFAFPKRDVNVSAVEELSVQAKVWDDLGVKGAGIVFAHQDNNREILLTEEELSGDKKHDLATMLAVEELGAKPRELITYYMWAEDLDREGKVRRTQSDMFLAEVRHFEDIFREQEPGGGQAPPGGQGQSEKLLKLQKDILNASWKVLREAHLGKSFGDLSDSIDVLKESQGIAIQKTDEAIAKVEDAELKSFFTEAKGHMQKAVEHFAIKVDPFSDPQLKKPPVEPLEMAHASVRSAYESLIKARSREHNVMQQQQPSSQGQPQEKEQQLMNLELKQKDLKYKENSSAQNEQQSAQQQENLEVLNKLKELARRQEAIAKKIKELQNELEEAKTREEKEQIERQLKRLQEEQQELLRELDDLSERMDSDENRADMAEERKKLEETRENVKDAAQELEENKLADAANSATRAQRDLEEVEDEFRKKTSHQFSEELKGIRQSARDLAEKQKEISKKLDDKAPENANSRNMFRTPKENQELARDIEEQRETLEKLVEEIKQVSEDAEESEPLLSDALYQAVRETTVNGVEESLAEAGRMVRYNHRNAAREPEQNAAHGIDDLKEKVEKAAEKILGSEADSLRLARAELDRLIEQSQSEAERMDRRDRERDPGESETGDAPQDRPGNGERPGEKGEGKAPGDSPKGAGEGKGEQESPKGAGKGKGDPKGKGEGEGKGDQPKGGEKGKGKAPGKGEGKGEKGEGKGEQPGEGKGDQPGKGKGKGEGQGKSTQLAQGDQPGQGKAKGKGKGKGEGKGEGSEESADGKGQGKGEGKGDSRNVAGGEPGKGKGQNSERRPRGKSLLSAGQSGRRAAGSNFGGDDRGSNMPTGLATQPPLFFDRAREQDNEPAGPITGEEYKDFANSLGNIEEMMNEEDLRNDVAKVLDNARGMRIDYKRDNLPPGAAEIRQKIVDPLVELRSRVSEELAKINRENPLAPIDRDPVPGEFRELVRRYYEELGAGK